MSQLRFRNLAIAPTEPVATWPDEAMRTALERGSLADFRRIATAIGDDPWGPVARQVESVLAYTTPYGAANLFRNIIERSRARAARSEKQAVATQIADAVASSGLSQREFASRIGTSQPRLSSYLAGKVTPSASLLVRIARVADRQPTL
ncbi:MAG: helix-turn-helix transcriptional regulator [Actinomycetia bacterium]|nr:helix-turn-helix transcriptional regulator [Actinomycetes bacterium]